MSADIVFTASAIQYRFSPDVEDELGGGLFDNAREVVEEFKLNSEATNDTN